MIAAFLKTDNGDFNYPALLVSIAILVVIAFAAVQLRRAIQKGYIWLVDGHGVHKKFEREANSTGFWFMFALYCLSILLFSSIVIVICFGLLRKPD